MKTVIYTAFLLFSSGIGFSQNCTIELKGHIEDADSRQKLYGASIVLKELNMKIVTDEQGDFVFNNLCPGKFTLLISHIGCEPVEQIITLTKNKHVDIDLPHLKNTLSEVTLKSQKGTLNTGFKKELSIRELDQSKGQNLAEALSRLNGVNLLQTGSTISKPIIHGLHSNRILTINNGVRQEGQQWGNEHAPEIDPFIAGNLVIVKGVDELKYGSDAIAGVILVEPKALRNSAGENAEINTAYFSNNRQWVGSAVFEQQLKKYEAFTYRIQGTIKKAANAKTPGYLLNNTGIEEENFSLTTRWKKHQFNTELFYSFFNTRLGIFEGAHIGNITDLVNAINRNEPDPVFTGENTYEIKRPSQEVRHQLLKSKTTFHTGFHSFSLLLAVQNNNRKEYDIVRNSSTNVPQMDLGIITTTQELQWDFHKKENLIHSSGISVMQQNNQYAGRYFIPAYQSGMLGGFHITKWNKNKWDVQAGIRFDHKNINSNRLRSGSVVFSEYDFIFTTIASSINSGYRINKQWKINGNITYSSRAPQVNELLSNGIHHGTATYEEGNILLDIEQALNFTLNNSWSNKSKKVSIDATLYSNQINNFIYQQPKPDEPVLTIAGAFPKLVYQQNDASLTGADLALKIQPVPFFGWDIKYSMLRAKNKDQQDWLIRMPADRIRNEFTLQFKDKCIFSNNYFSAEMLQVFKQTRVPDEKNGKQDYKDAPPAYSLFNLDAGSTILLQKIPVSIIFSVRNIFNTSYRDYLNSMRYFTDETGRNIQIRLKIPLTNTNKI